MSSITSELSSSFIVTLPAQPYPGLRPFEKNEWPIFFGRERMADAIVSAPIAAFKSASQALHNLRVSL